jgi:hypothetical protein
MSLTGVRPAESAIAVNESRVAIYGVVIHFTPKERAVLALFAQAWAVPIANLNTAVGREGTNITSNLLATVLYNIRKKMSGLECRPQIYYRQDGPAYVLSEEYDRVTKGYQLGRKRPF